MMRERLSKWARILRVYAFPVVCVPWAAATVLAARQPCPLPWGLLGPLALSLLLLHAGVNVINDYYDFTRGVDRTGQTPSSWALTDELLTPAEAVKLGRSLILSALVVAAPLVLLRGFALAWIALAGITGGYGYSAPPLCLKYHSLGEITVFLLAGPLLTGGVFLVLTGNFTAAAWYGGIPLGLLAAAILYGNNLRDRERDAAAGFRTLAHRFGVYAAWFYPLLILGAGLSLWPLVRAGSLRPAGAALVLAGLWGFRAPVVAVLRDAQPAMETIDRSTAQAYLGFGLIYIAALALS